MKEIVSVRLGLLSILLLISLFVQAHFMLDLNIRTIHIVHTSDGLDVYMRLPTSIFLAELVGDVDESKLPKPAPFTYNRIESGILMHYLDLSAIRKSPLEFASLAEQGQVFEANGKILEAEIVKVGLHPGFAQPPFSTLEEAKRAIEGPLFPYDYPEIYVGDTVTDLFLRFSYDQPIDSYTYKSKFNPGLEGQTYTANLILDYFPGNVRVYRFTGLLNEPVHIRNSEWSAISTFIQQGVIHILEGVDHVLFILCLTFGAVGLTSLLWRITGFTLGHTVTLILGFFGYVPSGSWFIPTVETAIAVSIIYAAVIALFSLRKASESIFSFAVITGIGLVHGLGFSFVLHELLLPGDAHLWKSLITFNIGVEIGQVLIVLVVWCMLLVLNRFNTQVITPVRWVVMLPCIGLATYWTVERAMMLAGLLFGVGNYS